MSKGSIYISVIIPCYNDGAYIQEAIESVKAQTCQEHEIIIVNDGSDDTHTNKILPTLVDDNIFLINLEKNSGPSLARNIAIDKAKGKYILPLDADDKIAPTYLEKAMTILESDKDIGIVYCEAGFFGKMSGKWNLPEYSLDDFLVNNMIFSTAMYRKEDWQKVGGYNKNMKLGLEDYDFWMSLIEKGFNVYQIKEVLFYYRQKEFSRTAQLLKNENEIKMFSQLFRNHIELYTDNIEVLFRKQRNLMVYEPFLKLKAVRYFFDSIKEIYFSTKYFKGTILKFFKGFK